MSAIKETKPLVFESLEEWKKFRSQQNNVTIAFVPTMGCLHRGHAELLKQARLKSDIVVCSLFVNPLQFSAGEDLEAYPRPFEDDLKICTEQGVDVVLKLNKEIMYPAGYATFVEELSNSKGLCGDSREGHFGGVCTVVLKMLNLVKPTQLYLGRKDLQQLFVVKKMLKDLNYDLDVIGVPTVREEDGLALSSRNRYLTEEQRVKAPLLQRTLMETVSEMSSGHLRVSQVVDFIKSKIKQDFKIDYISVVDIDDGVFEELEPNEKVPQNGAICLAAFLGKARLIDNKEFNLAD